MLQALAEYTSNNHRGRTMDALKKIFFFSKVRELDNDRLIYLKIA